MKTKHAEHDRITAKAIEITGEAYCPNCRKYRPVADFVRLAKVGKPACCTRCDIAKKAPTKRRN